jgi:nicotinamidase-related amidase
MAELKVSFQQRRLESAPSGFRTWQIEQGPVSLAAQETALVLCDVWDRHWCRGAEERLAAMLPQMVKVVTAARDKGVLIVHAPSETMGFYKDSPARQRVLQAAAVQPPPDSSHPEIPLPIDDSDGGGDTENDPAGVDEEVWTRQHPAIPIDPERDVISDNGNELYSYYHQRGIKNILIMGVHTNMCILQRTFAIKQMVRWGFRVALVRDLTDAMYNPAMPPYVEHAEGTRLVVEYIEKFWCPTITSEDIISSK